jgi:2-dehydropantoate 2-reductase
VRYIIIGAGAVGGTIGGYLFQGGHDVVLVARGPHLDALRAHGLKLSAPDGTSTLAIPAVGGPGELELRDGDVLVVATKTQDATAVYDEWAWRPVRGGATPSGITGAGITGAGITGAGTAGAGTAGAGTAAESLPVVCAQNGVASERLALRLFRHVYGMCVWLPATHLEPGTVQAQGTPLAGLLTVGRYPSGTAGIVREIAGDLAKSRFLAPVVSDVMRWKYGKLLSNLVNAIEALCGHEAVRQPDQVPGAGELLSRVRAEGVAVLDAAGIAYASDEESAAFRGDQVRIKPVSGMPRGGGSSWQSLTRGAGTIEADFLNGEIALLGREHDVPTPVNEALQRLANQAARERKAPGSTLPAEILSLADAERGG